jgi:hypothetical protein
MSDRTEAEDVLNLTNRWLAGSGVSTPTAAEYVPSADEVCHYASTHGRMPAEWVDRALDALVCKAKVEALREAAQIVEDTARQGGGLQTAQGAIAREADRIEKGEG